MKITDYDWLFLIIGKSIAGLIALIIFTAIGFLLWMLIGYIYGAFRYRRLDLFHQQLSWHTLIRIGWRWFLEALYTGGGWYKTHEGKKVYRFGFAKLVEDD